MQRGFTLVELTIVVVVVGVFAAVSLPRYAESRSRYQVELAGRKICQDLAVAQNNARYASTARVIAYDFAADSYSYTYSAATGDTTTATVFLRREPFVVALLEADFNGGATLTFNGFGIPQSGGQLAVGRGLRGKRIILDPDSGATTTHTLDSGAVASLRGLAAPLKTGADSILDDGLSAVLK